MSTGGYPIIALWSPKGGVGKSVLAAGLALTMARRTRTVLVDGNPDNPSLVILLQCPATPNISLWPAGAAPEQPEQHLVRHSSNLWVLPGPPRLVDEPSVTGPVMEAVLRALPAAGFSVVVELSPSPRDATLAALDRADFVLVPLTPDLLSLVPVRRLSRDLPLLKLDPARFRAVANRLTESGEVTRRDLAEYSPFPIAGHLPSSPQLAAAVNQGEFVRAIGPGTPFGRALEDLCDSLLGPRPRDAGAVAAAGLMGSLRFRRKER